jgi:hypothetical protein
MGGGATGGGATGGGATGGGATGGGASGGAPTGGGASGGGASGGGAAGGGAAGGGATGGGTAGGADAGITCGSYGFGPARAWPLPAGLPPSAVSAQVFEEGLTGWRFCSPMESRPGYFHADLTGDGRLDMVIFSLCEDPTVGATRWLVYPTNANGYGPPLSVSLPTGFGTFAFQKAPGTPPVCAAPNAPAYLVLDMTGDGWSDLLIYAQCTVPGWRLYPGSASGFGAPITWGLPTDGAILTFWNGFAHQDYCGSNQLVTYRYAAAELNGDGRIDLVATRACTDATVGTTKWLVYLNTGSGFAAPVPWTLPSGFSADAFSYLGNTGLNCAGGQDIPFFGVFDLDGDRRSDLVLFDTCDNTAGVQSWRVYPSTGTGFGMPYSKSWPAGYLNGAFARGYGAPLSCASGPGFPNYSLFDFDGVAGLDLVVTDTCQDPTVGTSRWIVHRSARMGFASGLDVTLPPDGGVMTSLSAPIQSCPSGWPYMLVDLSGDGRPDIVHNDSCGDPTIARSRWLLFENTCRP